MSYDRIMCKIDWRSDFKEAGKTGACSMWHEVPRLCLFDGAEHHTWRERCAIKVMCQDIDVRVDEFPDVTMDDIYVKVQRQKKGSMRSAIHATRLFLLIQLSIQMSGKETPTRRKPLHSTWSIEKAQQTGRDHCIWRMNSGGEANKKMKESNVMILVV